MKKIYMKRIILFGIGENGRKMVSAYVKCDTLFEIIAIADNNSELTEYSNIPVIRADRISSLQYDEIWVSTIYYREIRDQLEDEYHIEPTVIRYVEFPMPFLEQRIYEKYEDEIKGIRKCQSEEMQRVIDYISRKGVRMYCYPFYDEYEEKKFRLVYDPGQGLYYGVYLGHKMYLSKKYDTQLKAENYFRYICMEQDRMSPHCYFAGDFNVQNDDVGIDVGAAEGAFALEVIDRVEHVYLIESDIDWCAALALTFQPYKEKVTIINGFVSDGQDKNQIFLDSLFGDRKIDFIKMDIEGAERKALLGAEKIIEKDMPRLAICTYHHASDNSWIGDWLIGKGYKVTNSAGYVLCQGEWELDNLSEVDFRKALLWAERV